MIVVVILVMRHVGADVAVIGTWEDDGHLTLVVELCSAGLLMLDVLLSGGGVVVNFVTTVMFVFAGSMEVYEPNFDVGLPDMVRLALCDAVTHPPDCSLRLLGVSYALVVLFNGTTTSVTVVVTQTTVRVVVIVWECVLITSTAVVFGVRLMRCRDSAEILKGVPSLPSQKPYPA